MKKYTEEEKKKMIFCYFSKYYSSYKVFQMEKMKSNFGICYDDDMMQMYQSLNLLDDKENPYVGFTNLIESEFGLDKNILEVGGGVYPALANIISNRQLKIGKGTITVYDPALGIDKLNNIKLVKESFNRKTDISSYDLIISKEPCMATYDLIRNAKSNNKDFVISPCNCFMLLPEYIDYDADPINQWYEFIEELCSPKTSNFELKKQYLEQNYNYDHPIYTYKMK